MGVMAAYLVQLRFPGEQSWVTVAVAETRAAAAAYGAAAYANATNDAGARPTQVRIVTDEERGGGGGGAPKRPESEVVRHIGSARRRRPAGEE
jgi:hypothetical protein